jgi:molecular chaperone GrpE
MSTSNATPVDTTATPPAPPAGSADTPAQPAAAATQPEAAEPLAIPQTLTPEQAEALTSKAAKADEYWDRYVRAVAELDNYRKRAARERAEAVQHANEGLVRKLLPVLDNFEAALAAAVPGTTCENFKTGVAMIHSQLRQALAEAGVEEINAAGQAFDPNLHEAVAQLESAEVPEGHVLQQVRKGYRLHARLLRPASVVVAQPRPPSA